MMIWWIRISVVENVEKEIPFFVGQEMLFSQFHVAINDLLSGSNECTKIRFELNQTKNQQSQTVGLFTWESDDQLNILNSIEAKLELGVKNNMLDKKRKKEIMKYLTTDVYKNQQNPSGLKEKPISNSYPPINSNEVQSKDNELESKHETNVSNKEPLTPTEEETEKEPAKQPIIKQVKPKKTGLSKISLLLKQIPISQTIALFKDKWKWIAASVISLLLICSIIFVSVTFFSSNKANNFNDSFSVLKSEKDYKSMASEYPDEFWKWEEAKVEAMDTDILMEAYEAYPDEAIAFDIAFLGKAYTKVTQMYEKTPEKLRMNNTRYAFLGFSYLKENNLAKAEEMTGKSESQALYGQLALAYLRKGDVKKAEECNKISKDDDINVKIKDYQLVKTTLDEVNKQLGNTNLSKEIKDKLQENKQVLENELKKIKDGKDE
ncbi:hypothetical protein ACYYIK_002888 [Listeria monocytogenes]